MFDSNGPTLVEVLAILAGCVVSVLLIVLFIRLYFRVREVRDALYAAFDLENCYVVFDADDDAKKRIVRVRRRQRQQEG